MYDIPTRFKDISGNEKDWRKAVIDELLNSIQAKNTSSTVKEPPPSRGGFLLGRLKATSSLKLDSSRKVSCK